MGVIVSDLQKRIDEVADLMENFGLDEARLSGDDWTVEFSRTVKVAGVVTQQVVASGDTADAPVAPVKKASKGAPAAPKGTPLTSPMMGIFYSSPSPGSPAFVKEGESVTAGQVVGLIEAMKVFNELTAPMSGVVTKVMCKSGDLVQPGEAIMLIG